MNDQTVNALIEPLNSEDRLLFARAYREHYSALLAFVRRRTTPVAAFRIGPREAMLAVRDSLAAQGILVYHSTYIGAGADGVIRCGIFADHTREHIDALVEALRAGI